MEKGNFKVKCIKATATWYTTGNEYEVKNGILIDDTGSTTPCYRKPIKNFEDWKAFSSSNEWELVNDKPAKITIKQNGLTVTATLKQGKSIIKTAKAMCNPSDTFEFGIGAKLAVERLFGGKVDKVVVDEVHGVKEVKRRAVVGDWIKVIKATSHEKNMYKDGDILKIVKVGAGCISFGNCGTFETLSTFDEYIVLENYQPEEVEVGEVEKEELTIIKQEKYEVGDRVKLVSKRPIAWNISGEMDEYLGKIVTITSIASTRFKFEDENPWYFNLNEIEGKVITTPPITRVSRPAKVGEWVEIVNGNCSTFVGCKYANGDILNIIGMFDDRPKYGEGSCEWLYPSEYVVLENYTPPIKSEPTIKKVSRRADVGEYIEMSDTKEICKVIAYGDGGGRVYVRTKSCTSYNGGCADRKIEQPFAYIDEENYVVLENYHPIDLGLMPADGTLYATVEVGEIDYSKIDYTKLDGHRLFGEVKRRVENNESNNLL